MQAKVGLKVLGQTDKRQGICDRVKHNSSDTNKVFVLTGNKAYSMVDSELRIS